MHRQRTRFAARVHRVASALERRGVVATYQLHDRMLANRAARRRHLHARPALDDTQQRIVEQLRAEGYATIPFAELIAEPMTVARVRIVPEPLGDASWIPAPPLVEMSAQPLSPPPG